MPDSPPTVDPESGSTTGLSAGSATPADRAKQAAATGKEQAQQVAGTATEGAKNVAAEAGRQASELTGQASDQARQALQQATSQLRDQAGTQTERAASGARTLSEQLSALTSGRPEEAGAVGDYARQAGDKLQELASRLEDGGFDGVLEDVQRFARRRPGLFLAGAGAVGFAAGRMLRGAKAAQSGETDDGSGRFAGPNPQPVQDVGLATTPIVPSGPATVPMTPAGPGPVPGGA